MPDASPGGGHSAPATHHEPGKGKEAPKAAGGDKFKKYRPVIIGGGLLLLVILYFMLKKGGGSSAANTSGQPVQTPNSMDPSTGYPYGSAADIAALGGSGSVTATPGQTGAAGPTGPAGLAGPAGPTGPAGVNAGGPIGTAPHTSLPSPSMMKYTVQAGESLTSIANKFGISVATLAHTPGNVYVAGELPGNAKVGQQLGTGAGLKTGQVLNVPHKNLWITSSGL